MQANATAGHLPATDAGELPQAASGPWSDRWGAPPADVAIDVVPRGARAAAAREVADHLCRELELGRSLYCIVRDPYVEERIGGFDGRALPATLSAEAGR